MIVKNRKFSGGYRFRNFEGEPKEKIIETEVPKKVIIPLKQGFGNEVPSVVKEGESVKAGQIIGIDDDSISSPVHSTVNGVVEEIKKLTFFKRETNVIVIKSDGTTDWKSLEELKLEWQKLSAQKIEERLYLAGVTSLDRSGIPTRFKSSVISSKDVEHIIIHDLGSEVYSLPFFLSEGYKLHQFVDGLKIIKKIMPNARVHVALNKQQMKLIKQINGLVMDFEWVDLYPLEPKYPQGKDEVIIPTILDRSFPYGYLSAHIGVVVLSMQTIQHIYEAVANGKPLIERIISLCGPGFIENTLLRVRVGTLINDAIQDKVRSDREFRFIRNSPLTGETISDFSLPIDRTFSSIVTLFERKTGEMIAFAKPGFVKDSYSLTFASSFLNFKKTSNTNIHGEERPCIFCNFCEEVCPVGIIPHLLYRNVANDVIDETLLTFRIFHCIDCNLCSYVCPSKIQLAKYIKEGKEKLMEMGLDQSEFILSNFKLKGLEEIKKGGFDF